MLKTTAAILATATLASGGVFVDAQINPYEDRGATLEAKGLSVTPGAGEVGVKLTKARPEVRLERWNGEVGLGVAYESVNGAGARVPFTDRVEWKGAKEEVHAYPLPATRQMEDGGFEIEVVLKEKPDTNVFEFTIADAEDFNFFYQPEEIEEGTRRPENVVGSYAVYHKTHRDHVEGQTNYTTGKAFHIYRPKAIDADGNEVWAELFYADGVLSVTVPQNFLEGATYPVRVDPTFGYTTIGGTDLDLLLEEVCFGTIGKRTGTVATTTSVGGTLFNVNAYFRVYNDIGEGDTGETIDPFYVYVSQHDASASRSHAQISALTTTITATGGWKEFAASGVVTANTGYVLNFAGDSSDLNVECGSVTIPYDTTPATTYYAEVSFASFLPAFYTESPWTSGVPIAPPRSFTTYASYLSLPETSAASVIFFD